MEIILYKGYISSSGKAKIPKYLLENFLNFKRNRLRFEFDDFKKKINFIISETDEEFKKNILSQTLKTRKAITFSIKKKNIVFYFYKSRKLMDYFGEEFDLYYNHKKGIISFYFPDFKQKRIFIDEIENGVLTFNHYVPEDTRSFIEEKRKYGVLKLFQTEKFHSESNIFNYDLLITFKPQASLINLKNLRYFKDRERVRTYGIIDDRVYRRIFLGKADFPEFLNKKEKIELYIKGKEESEELKIVLDIDFYNLYLIENGVYTKQELDEFKKNLGSSDYYSHVKEFLLTIHGGFYYKEEYEDYINYIKDLLKENLLKYNFSKRKKRTRYYTEAKVIFMENHDILISNDLDLEIDLSLDLLKHELDDTWIKGLEKFKRKREESTRISEISEEEFKEISNLLSKIRLVSNEKMDSEFAQEVFFYYGFFKEYRKMLKVKIENGLNLNNSLMDYDLKKLAMNGSVFNMFIDTFPTNQIVVKNDFDFFIEYFTENTEMTEKQVLWVFSLFSNLSYLFDLNLDLRLIEDHFKNKFEDEKFLIDTIQVSFSYAKIKRKIFLIPHSELAALSFSIFLIINNLGEKIQIGNICNLLESRQSQINYYLGRVLSDEEITSELDEKIQPNERFSMFNKEKTRRLSGIVEYELIKNFLEYLSEKSKPEDLNTALEKEFLPRTLYFIRYNLTRKEEKKSLKLLYKRLKKALEKRYDILTEKNRNLIQAIFRF